MLIKRALKSLWFIILMYCHPVAGVREDSAQFLGELKMNFAIPFLFYKLDKDPAVSVQSEAVGALINYGKFPIPGLLKRLHSREPHIRYLVAFALHRISSELIPEPHPYSQSIPDDDEDYQVWKEWFEVRNLL